MKKSLALLLVTLTILSFADHEVSETRPTVYKVSESGTPGTRKQVAKFCKSIPHVCSNVAPVFKCPEACTREQIRTPGKCQGDPALGRGFEWACYYNG